MTQKDKELLFKDLCARLPYGVIIEGLEHPEIMTIRHLAIISVMTTESYKPYLRPMDSMTEEEIEILKSKCYHTESEEDWEEVRSDVWGIQILDKYDTRRWDNPIYVSTINMSAIDWLIANHFDYRGLIDMGLAIEVTKENNPYEE